MMHVVKSNGSQSVEGVMTPIVKPGREGDFAGNISKVWRLRSHPEPAPAVFALAQEGYEQAERLSERLMLFLQLANSGGDE